MHPYKTTHIQAGQLVHIQAQHANHAFRSATATNITITTNTNTSPSPIAIIPQPQPQRHGIQLCQPLHRRIHHTQLRSQRAHSHPFFFTLPAQ